MVSMQFWYYFVLELSHLLRRVLRVSFTHRNVRPAIIYEGRLLATLTPLYGGRGDGRDSRPGRSGYVVWVIGLFTGSARWEGSGLRRRRWPGAGGRLLGPCHQELQEGPVLGAVAGHGPVGAQLGAPGDSAALAVVRLARVRAQVLEAHQAQHQRVVGALLQTLRGERQHALVAPPGDGGPRPAVRVAADDGRAAELHHSLLIGRRPEHIRLAGHRLWSGRHHVTHTAPRRPPAPRHTRHHNGHRHHGYQTKYNRHN